MKTSLPKQLSANDRDLCKNRTAIFQGNRRRKHLVFCKRKVEQNSSLSILCMFIDQYYHQSFLGNFPLCVQEHDQNVGSLLPLPLGGAGLVQASGNMFFLNYLSPCISVREERYKTCNLCQEWKLIFLRSHGFQQVTLTNLRQPLKQFCLLHSQLRWRNYTMTRDSSFPCCGFQGGLFNIMRPDKRELALKMTEETKHHEVFWGS